MTALYLLTTLFSRMLADEHAGGPGGAQAALGQVEGALHDGAGGEAADGRCQDFMSESTGLL